MYIYISIQWLKLRKMIEGAIEIDNTSIIMPIVSDGHQGCILWAGSVVNQLEFKRDWVSARVIDNQVFHGLCPVYANYWCYFEPLACTQERERSGLMLIWFPFCCKFEKQESVNEQISYFLRGVDLSVEEYLCFLLLRTPTMDEWKLWV